MLANPIWLEITASCNNLVFLSVPQWTYTLFHLQIKGPQSVSNLSPRAWRYQVSSIGEGG